MQQLKENDSSNIVTDDDVENALKNNHQISPTKACNAAQMLAQYLKEQGAEYIKTIPLQLLHNFHTGQCVTMGPEGKEETTLRQPLLTPLPWHRGFLGEHQST